MIDRDSAPREQLPRTRYAMTFAAAAGFWLIEALVDMWMHGTAATLYQGLLPPDANEISMRIIIVMLIVAVGFHVQRNAATTRRNAFVLRRLIESTSDAFVALDSRWRITVVNGNAERLLAASADELIAKDFWELFPAGDSVFEPLRDSLAQGRRIQTRGYCEVLSRHVEARAQPFEGGLAVFFRDTSALVERERQLEEANRRLQAILDGAGDGIVTITEKGIVESFNRSAERMFGYHAGEIVGRNVHTLMLPDDAAQHDGYISRYLTTGRSGIIGIGPREVTARRKDGSTFPMELAVGEMRVTGGRHFVGIVRDIAERRRAEDELRRSRENLARAQSIAHLGSWSWETASGRLDWSDEVYRIFGHSPGSFAPTYDTFVQHIHPDDRNAVTGAVNAAMADGAPYSIEHRVVRPDGEWRIVHEQGEVIRDAEGAASGMIGTVQDITERRRDQEAIEFMANFDALTGLPNRSLMQYRLQQALSRAHRERRAVAVLLLDIDRFKTVNDTLGHATGDALIKTVAERITGVIREGDTAARLAGDEFAVVLDGIDDVEQVTDFVQGLRETLRESLAIGEHVIYPSACIGITLFPHDGRETEALLRHADAALRRAKSEGPDSYQFFTTDMTTESVARLKLEADLRRALDNDEFALHYQPQIDLHTGQVAGVEALLRWNAPGGLISPAQFVPVLEDTGLILPAGRWVLREACRQAKAWQQEGLPPLRMAVNISALQFRQKDFVAQVDSVLAETGLAPEFLELEITESLLVDNEAGIVEALAALHARGIRIAIDDFGTGYSSMGYLQRFPVHGLKIDRSFIKDVDHDPDSAAIARAILALAHSLRLRVVAEGVETAEQLAFLEAHDCDEVQGYYFARPLPAGDMPGWYGDYAGVAKAAG